MAKKITTQFLFLVMLLATLKSQTVENGTIRGRVYDVKNNEPVPFANIVIWGTNIGAASDFDGNFIFTGIAPGYIELRVSSVGYDPYVSDEILVTNAKSVFIDIPLTESLVKLDEVVITASAFRKKEESPNSLRRLGIQEIEKNPGGNRDISKVIQSLPGISPTVSYRNDLIVRGGGPGENRFFLDGIEIPNLNHFATQGASGGPVGILNVDFIREVEFYSSAFPASRYNSLSSVFEFKQLDGNPDKFKTRATLGASDLALTLNGPTGENSSIIFSARRSYLQFLFSVIGLPFLPTYNDYQVKYKIKLSPKDELSIISLGALDFNQLNLDANETEYQRYILDYLPDNDQWNYAIGAVYKHYRDNGFNTWVISRNYLNNKQIKYKNNIVADSLKTLDYDSDEIENKFRYENLINMPNGIKLNYGAGIEYNKYYNSTYSKIIVFEQPYNFTYESSLKLIKYGLFAQASKKVYDERLNLSLGIRTDATNYSKSTNNLLDQLSPRFSSSYAITEKLSANFTVGRYYQLPPYTALGFKNLQGEFINKKNNITYISADHIVSGIEFLPTEASKFTLEGFFKYYNNYPFSVRDSISLASKGGDFGTYGDEEVVSTSQGRSYGMEFFYRNKNIFGFNLITSYTLFWSEFKDKTDKYIPSSWDIRHIFNISGTRSFGKDWDVGFKWKFSGGAPYTPYDENYSSIKAVWDISGRATFDYNLFNSKRFKPYHQLDIRIDKSYFFKKWTLMAYFDLQNAYLSKGDAQDILVRETDSNGNPVIFTDAFGIERYKLKYLVAEVSAIPVPALGIIIEF
ncbi:MAG: TonB-dependent receptor [Bacteroidales bacterium]|nr:TonB-dependent receptor [Bacteroidales bacterium]